MPGEPGSLILPARQLTRVTSEALQDRWKGCCTERWGTLDAFSFLIYSPLVEFSDIGEESH